VTHTSLRSDCSSPKRGVTWIKPPNGFSREYTSSSSTPSTLSGAVSLMARTVAWPDAARVMTSGAIGAGGPSRVDDWARSSGASATARIASAVFTGAMLLTGGGGRGKPWRVKMYGSARGRAMRT